MRIHARGNEHQVSAHTLTARVMHAQPAIAIALDRGGRDTRTDFNAVPLHFLRDGGPE